MILVHRTYFDNPIPKKSLGLLSQENSGHAVIQSSPNEFMVIGGEAPDTQKCTIQNEIECKYFNTIDVLSIAVNYPEVFLVQDDYCKIL